MSIRILEKPTYKEIRSEICHRKPFLVRGYSIGNCSRIWTTEYVCEKLGNKPVKIHVSSDQKLDFVKKNFLYKTLPFDELMKRISTEEKTDFFINPREVYYLRSLGSDPRGKGIANIMNDFPELAEDIKIPPIFDDDKFFSAILRISSAGVQLWTHYDIMDNILIQIRGKKRVILWPPTEVGNLYLVGDKSEVIEVDCPDPHKYPKFLEAIKYECVLQEGDMIFIPALWFHNITALETSLGVNFFWKNLPNELYEKNDSYGNKDLTVANRAFRTLENSVKSLDKLPDEYKNFYIQRMINFLERKMRNLSSAQ